MIRDPIRGPIHDPTHDLVRDPVWSDPGFVNAGFYMVILSCKISLRELTPKQFALRCSILYPLAQCFQFFTPGYGTAQALSTSILKDTKPKKTMSNQQLCTVYSISLHILPKRACTTSSPSFWSLLLVNTARVLNISGDPLPRAKNVTPLGLHYSQGN